MIDGQIIAKRRMSMGLNQAEASMGICTPSMISQVENNKATLNSEKLKLLCERLGLDIEIKFTNQLARKPSTFRLRDLAQIMESVQELAKASQDATVFGELVVGLLREHDLVTEGEADGLSPKVAPAPAVVGA